MNRAEFIGRLNKALAPLDEHERSDIIMDYAEHFDAGAASGSTQEEIAQRLGSPEELAQPYLDQHYGAASAETPKYAPPYYNRPDTVRKVPITAQGIPQWVAVLIIVFAACTFAIPAAISIAAVIASIWVIAAAFLVTGISICAAAFEATGAVLAGVICVSIGFIGLSFSTGVLALVTGKYFVKLIKWIVQGCENLCRHGQWNEKVCQEGVEQI